MKMADDIDEGWDLDECIAAIKTQIIRKEDEIRRLKDQLNDYERRKNM